jgi:alpha-glucosidase (family GH31 glycosyl hydrolase)
MGPEMSFVGQKKFDPLTFAVYPDENGSATASLYDDDGVSPAYKQGAFRRTTVSVSRAGSVYRVSVSKPEGSFDPGARELRFEVVTERGAKKRGSVQDSGAAHTVEIR